MFLALAADPAVNRYGDPLPPGAVARIGSLRWRCESGFTGLTVLPDRRHAAFADGDQVGIINLDSGKIVRRISRPTKSGEHLQIMSLALAADGRTIAVGCDNYNVADRTIPTVWLTDL